MSSATTTESTASKRLSSLRGLAARPTFFTASFLAVLVIVFSILGSDSFLSSSNLRNVALDTAVLLVLATGATFVIITAGIDLSVGAVLVFSGVVSAKAMLAFGVDGPGAIVVGLVVSVACGLGWGVLNGYLIAVLGIPSFIATLGTLGASTGFALLITGAVDITDIPDSMPDTIGYGEIAGVPWLVIIAVVVAAVAGVVLGRTRFGRITYAIGSNGEAVRRAGVRVDRHLIKVYAIAGGLAGLGGFLSLARFSTTDIGGHSGDNLQAIAIVVLGGASLFGGIGTVAGTAIAAFIPSVLRNGFVILGIQPFWQQVAIGVVLVVAVYVDQLRRRRQQR